ncbi:probable cytochrome P450 305a1 isoform X2 [Daktulosphaira vitifoliae]|uniref:probable cytochrome P450 305a1 isoform X2 n=1 Tax=Daktulosphaira vitifoliae TaxID=58002 RepID=UPI0021AAB7F3|nr:probable cytochrome P450 305a1 isoform X2 [Daktulosphaira vitifoliae]
MIFLMLWPYTVCCVIISLLLAAFLNCKKPTNFPPGPRWIPFLGCTYQLTKLSSALGGQHKALENLRNQYNSDIIGLKLGHENVVVVYGNNLINEILHGEEFQGRPNNFFIRLRTMGKRLGITMTDGELWKLHKEFVVKCLKNLSDGQHKTDALIREEFEQMKRVFLNETGSVIPGPYFQTAAINILWQFTAGTKFIDSNIISLMSKRSAAFNMTGGLLSQIPWIRCIAPKKSGFKLIKDINQQLFSLISKIINEHKQSLTDNPKDFIDMYLLKIKKENNSNTTFTDEQLIATCLDLFIAGSKTTSSTLDFAILAMAKWPSIQAKVQAYLDTIKPPGTFLLAEDILECKYLQAVLIESKRLSHITPLIGPRRVLRNTKLDGYNIPKDSTVLMSLYSIHYDPLKWESPEEFRPERFIDENGNLKKNNNLYFFGHGKRRCPGESLAQRFILLMFANLIHDFEIKMEELPSGLNCGILVTSKPYKVKLYKRK